MKINSNIQALVAQNVLRTNEEKNAASTERLSSGFKINHGKDSPAGMAIGNRMNAQIRSLYKAKDNANNAVNVVQTADGALTEVHNMLQRMNELAVKASTGTLTSADRNAIQKEVSQLSKEINRVAKDTEYNTQNLLGGEQQMKGYSLTDPNVSIVGYDPDFEAGKKYEVKFSVIEETVLDDQGNPRKDEYGNLIKKRSIKEDSVEFKKDGQPYAKERIEVEDDKIKITNVDGSSLTIKGNVDAIGAGGSANTQLDITGIGGMKIQVGTKTGQEIRVVIPKMDTDSMGIKDIDMSTAGGAQKSIEKINKAIEYVSASRSRLGAYQNRLESTIASLAETTENLEGSYSTVKDVDMAEEMVEYTKLQVLVQAGTSMLSQANEQPQQALQLLQ
ncbi:MAG: flagellin FliC3 [Lachnospiraceae bacterium]|nr:flagellin FliC3 [Lachnospiraceae bacterium]